MYTPLVFFRVGVRQPPCLPPPAFLSCHRAPPSCAAPPSSSLHVGFLLGPRPSSVPKPPYFKPGHVPWSRTSQCTAPHQAAFCFDHSGHVPMATPVPSRLALTTWSRPLDHAGPLGPRDSDHHGHVSEHRLAHASFSSHVPKDSAPSRPTQGTRSRPLDRAGPVGPRLRLDPPRAHGGLWAGSRLL